VSLRASAGSGACGRLRRVAEPFEQVAGIRELGLEVLLVALQALDQLLPVREAAATAAAVLCMLMLSFLLFS
jgi:hypothetical protein